MPPDCALYADLSVAPPTSHDGEFPYLRDCDGFEAVMVYKHIDDSQMHIQSLGFEIRRTVQAVVVRRLPDHESG